MRVCDISPDSPFYWSVTSLSFQTTTENQVYVVIESIYSTVGDGFDSISLVHIAGGYYNSPSPGNSITEWGIAHFTDPFQQ